MKTEIVCAIIALVGTAVSGLLSWFVSRSSAVKEVEKLRLTWEHETIVTSDDEFAEMVSSVALLYPKKLLPALITQFAELPSVRSKEQGPLADSLTTFIAFF